MTETSSMPLLMADSSRRRERGWKILRFELENFKSHSDTGFDIPDYSIFIGANSAGKSNIFSALNLVRDIADTNPNEAIAKNGGYASLARQTDRNTKIGVRYGRPLTLGLNLATMERGVNTLGPLRIALISAESLDYILEFSPSGFSETIRIQPENGSRIRDAESSVRRRQDTSNSPYNQGRVELESASGSSKESIEGWLKKSQYDGRIDERLVLKIGEFARSVTGIAYGNNMGLMSFSLSSTWTQEEKNTFENNLQDAGIRIIPGWNTQSFERYLPRGPHGPHHPIVNLARIFLPTQMMARISSPSFARIKIFDFQPKLMKSYSGYTTASRLMEDGSNIVMVLKRLLEKDEEKKLLIQWMKMLLPQIESIRVEELYARTSSGEQTVGTGLFVPLVEESYSGREVTFKELSDGTVSIIAFLVATIIDDADVLVIEEPERNVHPKLIPYLIEIVKERSREKQILLSTHNPEFLRFAEKSSIRLVYRDESGSSNVIVPEELERVRQLMSYGIGMETIFTDNLFGIQ